MVVVTDGDLVSLDIVRQNISGNTGRCGELSNVIPLKLFWYPQVYITLHYMGMMIC